MSLARPIVRRVAAPFARGLTEPPLGGLEAAIRALFPDVWYDPSDFNPSWRRNLLTYSEQFDNAAWTKSNATVTANAVTAPDGTLTADKLVETSANNSHYCRQGNLTTVAANYTYSVYLKAAERTWAIVVADTPNGTNGTAYVFVDLVSGSFGSQYGLNGYTFVSKTIDNVGGGWYRVSIVYTANARSDAGVNVFTSTGNDVITFAGDTSKGIYLWGAQLELGTTASAYQKITDGVADYYVYGSPLPVLYQDSAGTTPVTALEQPVGLMLDKSRGLVLGAELVTNGDFDSSAGWATAAGVSIGSGVATFSSVSTTSALYRAASVSVGKWYQVTVVVSSASGTLRPRLFGGALSPIDITAPGTYTFRDQVTGANTNIGFATSGVFTGVVDSISVRELPGYHAYHTPGDTTTRPTVSRRINLLTKTEQFDDAAWTKTASTAVNTADTLDPQGGATADKLLETATTAEHYITQARTSQPAGSYTLSVYLKAAERSFAAIDIDDAVSKGVKLFVNLSTGAILGNTVLGSGYSYVSGVSTSAGNGWYLVQLTVSTGAGTTVSGTIQVRSSSSTIWSDSYAGDTSKGIYIWGASLVPADLAALGYQRVNTTTDYDSDASKWPTFLRTDGVNDSLQTNAIDFSGTDKMFVGAAVRKLSDAAYGVVCDLSSAPDTMDGAFSIGSSISRTDRQTWGAVARGTSVCAGGARIFSAPDTRVLSASFNIGAATPQTEVALRLNGAAQALDYGTTLDAGTGNFGNHKLYLFMRGGTSLPFNGWMFGLLVKGSALSASQIALAERWLAAKTKTVTLA